MPESLPKPATSAMSCITAGLVTSQRSATRWLSRAAAVTYCVRSFEPMEKNSAAA